MSRFAYGLETERTLHRRGEVLIEARLPFRRDKICIRNTKILHRICHVEQVDVLPAAFDESDGPHACGVPDERAAADTSPCAEDVYSAICEPDDEPVGVKSNRGRHC